MNKARTLGYTMKGGNKMNMIQKIALVLTIVGALNWGFIGLFNFREFIWNFIIYCHYLYVSWRCWNYQRHAIVCRFRYEIDHFM